MVGQARALYVNDDWNGRLEWVDGRCWHFDKRRLLVRQERPSVQVQYRWDEEGHLTGQDN